MKGWQPASEMLGEVFQSVTQYVQRIEACPNSFLFWRDGTGAIRNLGWLVYSQFSVYNFHLNNKHIFTISIWKNRPGPWSFELQSGLFEVETSCDLDWSSSLEMLWIICYTYYIILHILYQMLIDSYAILYTSDNSWRAPNAWWVAVVNLYINYPWAN